MSGYSKRQVVIWMMLLVGATISSRVSAQFFGSRSAATRAGRFIEPDRSMRQKITDATKAIEEERYSDAIIQLGDLLLRKADIGELSGQDFFDRQAEETLANKSVLRQAEDLLGELPAKGIEIYRIRYGSVAKNELQQAVNSGDWAAIRSVSRKYLHTEAGYQATMLLGYHHIASGAPLAAATCLQRLYSHKLPRQKYGAGLSALLAGCWFQSGNTSSAVDTMLDAISAARSVEVGGKDIELPEVGSDKKAIEAWLAEHFGKVPRVVSVSNQEEPIVGGDAGRTGYRGSEMPLKNERWQKKTTRSNRQEDFLKNFQTQRAATDKFPIPTWQPIVVGNTVLAKSTYDMMAVDFETGLLVWEGQLGSTGVSSAPAMEAQSSSQGEQLLVQQVWNDLPYGRISSDGTRVYMLQGLGEVLSVTFTTFGQPLGAQGMRQGDTGTNTLVALNIEQEGKLEWQVGKTSPELLVEPELNETFFLGPPLPVNGSLYVIGEQKGDIFLFCIDPETGRLDWRQHLVAIETGTINNDALRRIGGAMPSYADGILVCPTGHGAVVAVDLTTRTLRWGYRFGRTQRQVSRNFSNNKSFDTTTYLQRWNDGTPIIDNGRVLLTPIEGDRLYAVDLMTGKSLWSTIPREDWLYLGGVQDETAVLVGHRQVMGISTASGSRKWVFQLPESGNEIVSGRGVFGDDSYMFPTFQNRLIEISLENGKEIARKKVRFPLGNLVSARGQLISQSATHLSVSRGVRSTQEDTAARLADDPNNFEAIMQKGELLLESGQRDDALDWLGRAYKIDSSNEDVRQLMVEALLEAIGEDFDGYSDQADLLSEMAELPEEREKFLRLMASGYLKAGKLMLAAKNLLELSTPIKKVLGSSRSRDSERIEFDGRSTTLDGWIAARVNEINSLASAEQRDALGQLVSARVAAFSSITAPPARRMLKHFAPLSACDPIREQLANKYVREGSLLKAERVLLDALEVAESAKMKDQWNGMLARVYWLAGSQLPSGSSFRKADWLADAVHFATKVEDWGQVKFEDASQLEPVKSLAGSKPSDPPSADWPQFVHASDVNDEASQDTSMTATSDLMLQQTNGKAFAGWGALHSDNNSSLHMLTPHGIFGPSMPLDTGTRGLPGPRRVYFDRGVMVAVLPSSIIGIDLFRATENQPDMELFSRPWRQSNRSNDIRSRRNSNDFGQMQHMHYANSLPALRTSSIYGGQMILLQARSIKAMDIRSGEDNWQTTTNVDDGYVVLDSKAVSVLSPSEKSVVHLDINDGSLLDKKEDWFNEDEEVWTIAGPNVLSYSQVDDEDSGETLMKLRLWCASTNEVILEDESLLAGVCGEVVNNRYVVVLEPDGALQVWDLLSGKRFIQAELPLESDLDSVHALVWNDRLVVMPDVEMVNKEFKFIRNLAQRHMKVSGPAMAYSLETGKPMWDEHLKLKEYGVTVGQPTSGPLMFLSRREKQVRATKGIPRWNFRVAAIDIRNGKVVAEESGLKAPAVPIEVVTQVQIRKGSNEYDVKIQNSQLRFVLKDDPPPKPKDSAEKKPEDAEKAKSDDKEPFGLFEPVE